MIPNQKPTKSEEPKLTLGEKRVRSRFNPDLNSKVDEIKHKTAELINLVQDIQEVEIKDELPVPEEQSRLIALAQTSYEEAAMWAVKAATA